MSPRIRSLAIGTVLSIVGACSDAGVQAPDQNADFGSIEQGVTGKYRLKAVHSGKCAGVANASMSDGGNVEQRTCSTTTTNQQWDIVQCSDGTHLLKAVHSGKFMNVAGNSTADGANIQQWGSYTCSSTAKNVRFSFISKGSGQYQLRAAHSAKCVDVKGGTSATGDGVNIHQWRCNENNNQRFTLEPVSSSGGLPSGWSSRDIGSVGATGSASYSSGTYTVKGAGADIWGYADAFRFTHRSFSGDGTITARVGSLTNTNSWAKAGVMFRETTGTGSKHAFMAVSPVNGVVFQRRTATSGSSASTGSSGSPGIWLRVRRAGSTFTGYKSTDGSTWSTVGSVSISMSSSLQVGLAVTSHVAGTLTTATFSNVSVATSGTTEPPPPIGITWKPANLTWYTSWPCCCPDADCYDPRADDTECRLYNGCTWAGYFAGVSGRQSEAWVKSHNIMAVHERDWSKYKLKTFRLRKDGKEIDAVVYDMCSDSDCDGCCTKNASANGYNFLIDVEKYTLQKWGISQGSASGRVDWYCKDC